MEKVKFKSIIRRLVSITGLSVVFGCIFISCDTFEEDRIREADRLENKNNLTILANTSAVVDFRTLIKVNGLVNVQMTKEPDFGTFNHLGDELYKYTPFKEYTSGVEVVPFTVYGKENNFLFSDTLNINIVTDLGDSCYLYASPDQFYVKSDTSSNLDVLANDMICISPDKVTLSIIKQPDHGSVNITENNVSYTSSGYKGTDEFAYRIQDNNDPAMTSDALVTLDIADGSCHLKANDDSVQYNLDVPGLKVDVLYNDITCGDSISTMIISGPTKGTARFESGNYLLYNAYDKDSAPYIDSLRYQVCENGICGQAKVSLHVYSGSCNELDAFDDMVDISDTTLVDGVYSIDVIANDIYCSRINLDIIKDPDFGAAYIKGNKLHYEPDTATIKNDEIIYELCDELQLCDQATVFINREN